MNRVTGHSNLFSLLLLASACSSDSNAVVGDGTGSSTDRSSETTASPGTSGAAAADATSSDVAGTTIESSDGDGAKFDVAAADLGGAPSVVCKVVDDMDAPGDCTHHAPPDSFEPEIQWTWQGPPDAPWSVVTPLVANLTDDNGDGEIDLCDVPDVLVVSFPLKESIHQLGVGTVLDGETGIAHSELAAPINHSVTPAIGDIDGDGVPEIVTANAHVLLAFEHDGALKWTGTHDWVFAVYGSAIALADLDNDGDVEILAGNFVTDHEGALVWVAPEEPGAASATTAADLDGDGALEVILGRAAYRHDGTPYYTATDLAFGIPQVANLDADPEPEVLVMTESGINVLEHDGAVKYQDLRPTGDPVGSTQWRRPATVHDFDGDGAAEFAASSASHFTVYEGDAGIVWSAEVNDLSGIAAGTAFDFLGDGIAEAMYADETTLFVFDGAGVPLFETPRTSGTFIEYPVVADIDNDGSAEILVVSNGSDVLPTVQAIRDADDRWIPARRIWNQHTYHVTNVREDGTIPQFEPPHHELLNTFRTNAQVENGGVCQPQPEG